MPTSFRSLLGIKKSTDKLPPDFPRNADGTPKHLSREEWQQRIAEKHAAIPKGASRWAGSGKDGVTARSSGFTMITAASGL